MKTQVSRIERPDGSLIAWHQLGSLAGKPVIFSNSLGADVSMWNEVAEALAPEFRLIFYDTRGHGESQASSARASLDDLCGDLLAVMDAADCPSADIIGLSLGGMTGLFAALRFPDRVDRLMACNCRARVDEAAMKSWEDRIAALHAGGVKSLVKATLDRWFTPAFQETNPLIMERVAAMVSASSDQGYEACVRAIQTLALHDHLSTLSQPVLYLAGAQDMAAPPDEMRAMAQATPQGRLEVLDPCGHMASIERSADFVRLARGFLR
ncbi:MAG: alpha/beta fold hydrolase [Betaproteobacteria bacterium]|nr:alpha/beta fold hydrolase [Betaproteobacteria bacterium]